MLVHFWIPTMQLSAFADTKVPLILNPWSCSEFNHLHDTKWYRGGVRWGYSRSLLPRLGPSWEKSAWKQHHLCPHLLFVEKHHLRWKPLQPFSDYWKTGEGKCRQSLIPCSDVWSEHPLGARGPVSFTGAELLWDLIWYSVPHSPRPPLNITLGNLLMWNTM